MIGATRSAEIQWPKAQLCQQTPHEPKASSTPRLERSSPLEHARKKKGGGSNHRVLRTERVTVGTADVILVLLGPHPKLEAASNNFACTGLAPRSRDSAM